MRTQFLLEQERANLLAQYRNENNIYVCENENYAFSGLQIVLNTRNQRFSVGWCLYDRLMRGETPRPFGSFNTIGEARDFADIIVNRWEAERQERNSIF